MMDDLQGIFEFPEIKEKITFDIIEGQCKCGEPYEIRRCNIAIEMTIICNKCKNIVAVGKKEAPSIFK